MLWVGEGSDGGGVPKRQGAWAGPRECKGAGLLSSQLLRLVGLPVSSCCVFCMGECLMACCDRCSLRVPEPFNKAPTALLTACPPGAPL